MTGHIYVRMALSVRKVVISHSSVVTHPFRTRNITLSLRSPLQRRIKRPYLCVTDKAHGSNKNLVDQQVHSPPVTLQPDVESTEPPDVNATQYTTIGLINTP